jgi:hypothetical protein
MQQCMPRLCIAHKMVLQTNWCIVVPGAHWCSVGLEPIGTCGVLAQLWQWWILQFACATCVCSHEQLNMLTFGKSQCSKVCQDYALHTRLYCKPIGVGAWNPLVLCGARTHWDLWGLGTIVAMVDIEPVVTFCSLEPIVN